MIAHNPPDDAGLEMLTIGRGVRLEDLVDRNSLQEVVQSFTNLFGVATRIFSADGHLLADSSETQPICQYVREFSDGRAACSATVDTVKRTMPKLDEVLAHPCFTGANYKIVALSYDARVIGKIVLGPFLPHEIEQVPGSLIAAVKGVDEAKAGELLSQVPRARPEVIAQIADHLRAVLDLILFSGHRALLTSQMHLASVRESYRELQEKSASLEEAYEKLKELDRLKSNFIATVSHELRTPLTSIVGYAEMLAEGIAGPLSAEQGEFVGTIQDKSQQLLGLIVSLLDMSKLESGVLSLQKQDVNVRDLLTDVASALVPTARKKGVILSVAQMDQTPTVNADRTKMRQVLLNLADNALKFTPSGGAVTLSARTAVDAPGGLEPEIGFALLAPARSLVEICVADTGIGIPEKERNRIFDPFYQVDSSSTREYGGTGLGLAIVKRLVEAHDGKISVLDNKPRGTVFRVVLPASSNAA